MKKISIVLLAFLMGTVLISSSRITLSTNGGATWIKYSGNPLNVLGIIYRSCVIYDEPARMFKMWYDVVPPSDPQEAWRHQIHYAVSPDGIDWSEYGVVLDIGASGSWDDGAVWCPAVIFDGTTYRMWYEGYRGTSPETNAVGYATSSDGVHWVKHGANPVLVRGENGGWDDWHIAGAHSVIYSGTQYVMWYTAQAYYASTYRTGVATSTDGISWTKYSSNPVLSPGSGWDDTNVWAGPVIKNENYYMMWYTAHGSASQAEAIGLATSADGFSWSRYAGNPVLEHGPSGSWDEYGIFSLSVVQRGNMLLMYYRGMYNELPLRSRIGLATSHPRLVDFLLHGGASLDTNSPTALTAKYQDSPSVKFGGGNPWKEIGTWAAPASLTYGRLDALGGLDVWLGLKNSDDQGTNFDLRAEVYMNGVLVASGETYLIKGVTRNPDKALKVTMSFGSFSPVDFDGTTDILSLKILARIGTDGNGAFGGGHSSAVGLRLYFDAVNRPAMLAASIA